MSSEVIAFLTNRRPHPRINGSSELSDWCQFVPTPAGGSYSGILRLSKIWGEQEKLHEKTLIITPRGVQSNVGQNLTQKFKSLKVRKVQLRIDGGGEFTYNGPHLLRTPHIRAEVCGE
jgi:hypothetical protein